MKSSQTTSNIHPKLSKCNSCSKKTLDININISFHPDIKECNIVKCNQCQSFWYVCLLHNKRFSASNKSKMVKHFGLTHPEKEVTDNLDTSHENCPDETQNYKDNDVHWNNDTVWSLDDDSAHSLILSPPISSPTSSKNLEERINDNQNESNNERHILLEQFKESNGNFFIDEICKTGNGICGITAKAFAQSNYYESKSTLEEASFHLQATQFCSNLTESQQKQLASLLNQVLYKKFVSTKIPSTIGDIKKFYMSGKYSMYQNLPCPKTFQMDNHACVSITDILCHSLAIGIELNLYKSSYHKQMAIDNKDLYHIRRSHDILKEVYDENKVNNCDPYVVLVIIWSDDFEVNHTRKNSNSTWLKTLTIIPPPNMTTSKKHTNALCIGRKNQDHSTVNTFYQDEMTFLSISKERYVKQLQRCVPTVARILAMSSDRPERCTLNSVLNYSGLSTRRWLYSSLTDPFKISSCKRCLSKRFQSMFITNSKRKRETSCGYCCDFDYDTKKNINTFPLPDKYPRMSHPNSPIAPTDRDVKFATKNNHLRPIKLTYDILVQGLDFATFNYHTNTWSKKETNEYLRILGVSSRTTKYVIEYANSFSSKTDNIDILLKSFTHPSLWKSGLRLDSFLETPMHHLFEGIVKTIIEIQMDFFKEHNKWATFGFYSNSILTEVNQLKVSYCRAEPFTSGKEFKTGGWIAETYLGYSRLMIVLLNQSDRVITSNTLGYNELVLVIQTLYALISRLMQHDANHSDAIDDYVKLFLSVCHYYQKKVGFGENSYPFWYRKSNFVSLLNLSDQIKEYGPLYLHWEGVREKFIQHVKPTLTNMRTTASYLVTKLEKIHRDQTLEMFYDNTIIKRQQQYNRYDDFETFKNTKEITHRFENNLPITGITINLAKTTYGVIVQSKMTYEYHSIEFDDNNGFHRSNLWYTKIKLMNNSILSFTSKEEIVQKTEDYVLFVPLYSEEIDTSKEYTVLSKNWKCRSVNNRLSTFTPSIPSLQNFINTI